MSRDKVKLAAYSKDYWDKNKDKLKAQRVDRMGKLGIYKKEYYEAHKDKYKAYARKANLKAKYNLTVEEYDQMLISQNGLCCICRDPIDKLVVDHNHTTGKVRGLLCPPCNKVLGFSRDSIAILENAITYLTINGAQ